MTTYPVIVSEIPRGNRATCSVSCCQRARERVPGRGADGNFLRKHPWLASYRMHHDMLKVEPGTRVKWEVAGVQ